MGSKLLMFGGSLELSNDVTTLDLATRTWARPAAVLGSPPGKRMSAVVALSRTDFLVFGGWIYASGEVSVHCVRAYRRWGHRLSLCQVIFACGGM